MRKRKFTRLVGILISVVLVLIALSQCWSADRPSNPGYHEEEGLHGYGLTQTAPQFSPAREVKAPTAVLAQRAGQQDLILDEGSGSQALTTAAPDPLRFVFPDAPPNPVSAWRPPLYPVPWAPTPFDHFYFSRPIAADEVNWPLANYRYGGVFFEEQVHTGVDIPASKGTPVLAAGDGKVVWAGWGLYRGILNDTTDPYGQAVVIRHDFGYQGLRLYTVYGHLDQIDIPRGTHVLVGEQIGLVGDTGFVTGPHLHFEVRVGESDFFKTYNPELWLVPPQGWGIAVARVLDTSGYFYLDEVLRIESRKTGQVWKAIPYADGPVNSDPYYRENMVISDLPAGLYDISISYAGRFYNLTFEIYPGRVTYFSFQGRNGFSLNHLPDPSDLFSPDLSGLESP